MKSVCFVKVISGCLIAVGTIVPPALSFPFAPTSDGLAAFLNSRKWEDGKKRTFSGLRKCEKWSSYWYGCRYGYIRIVDPVRGVLFCELRPDPYGGNAVQASREGAVVVNGQISPCRKD